MQPSELVTEEMVDRAAHAYNAAMTGRHGLSMRHALEAVALDIYERGLWEAAEAAAATAEYLHGTNFLVAATGAETARTAILSKLRSAT